MGQLQIVGGQPVSTRCRKHCVLYIKIISRQLLTCVGFFAYLILGPMEHTLDTNQLEEQHGFSSKYRVEEHLLAANLFPYEATAHGIPVWFVTLDVSRAFECLWPCALAFSLTCIAC